MTRQVELSWSGGLAFVATTGSGHEIILDAGEDSGGGSRGARPTEALLIALAACAAMDALSILRKMRVDVRRYHVRARGEQASTHPQRFTEIEVVHRVSGDAIKPANVHRAIQLSITRYCPVYAMIAPDVAIAQRFEIIDREGCVVASAVVEPEAVG